MSPDETFTLEGKATYAFRPWVRRAGWSILIVAAVISAAIGADLLLRPGAKYGWTGEAFVWVYVGTLWLGGAKVFFGTLKPVAEVDGEGLVLRPLHQFTMRRIPWSALLGTEQMIGGDRLIVYYDASRGLRFVALNLNLIKGRRDFLTLVDDRLKAMGFTERIVERSRYLSKRSL